MTVERAEMKNKALQHALWRFVERRQDAVGVFLLKWMKDAGMDDHLPAERQTKETKP